MKNALLRAWYHRGAASLAGRSSLVPRATGSFPVSGVDEEHFTHTHHMISLVLEARDIPVNKIDTNSDLMEFTF